MENINKNNEFIKCKYISQVLEALSHKTYSIICGGTDLIIDFRSGKKKCTSLVDISSINELKVIEKEENIIKIGAACTHSDIEKSEIIKEYVPILAKACSNVGSTLIRNKGTIGGNIVNNSASADSVPALLILDASLDIQSKFNKRKVKLKDFFIKRGKIDLNEDELITSIEFEILKDYKWDLIKVQRRRSLAISRLTLAIALKEENRIIKDLRICPGAMLPSHARLWETEGFAKGKQINNDTINQIQDKASKEVISVTGVRWSTEYKDKVLRGLIIRTLEKILSN